MPIALLALVISAFGIGTTEFVTMGLVPQLTAEFDVSVPTVGLLVSAYAFGVTVGAPILTLLGARVPRKTMLLSLMGFYLAGNLISALAPSYGVLMTGRIVASFTHGAFFGIGAVVAASLVAPEKRARAIALMFTGVTLANVLGAPGGTVVGQLMGWRAAFWAIILIGAIAFVALWALVPAQPRPADAGIARELAVFRRPQVWLALGMTVIGYAPVFAVYTYIEPILRESAGFGAAAVPIIMALFGVGLVLGNLYGGRMADRRLMPTVYLTLAGITVVAGAFWFTAGSQIAITVTVFVFGFIGFASVPPLQMRVLNEAEGAPALASAANIGAFNLGNALGPFLSGITIEAGLGLGSAAWVGVALGVVGLSIAVVSGTMDRRAARVPRPEPVPA
ncbi:MFS transporter [Stackebrandtia nassauensis]|uniref:Major facilitator superfamily MFS_1 n=1 Tax=Stackebrandtia nassauensis (strain DSM 44728 / CIP 108903 / NRRL B-16338 / NBRC 102104 / LLR-40K-21) TaxID=446470 RepID=D3PZM3_STANL|nr:MFS transporter [Stackebrandtia nassauensis]ADD43560.1 major facilitator superfamily MFS_1 [Stackebrandtia nassauensis DSM 44728]